MNRRLLTFLIAHGVSQCGSTLAFVAVCHLVFLRDGGTRLGFLQAFAFTLGLVLGSFVGTIADHRSVKQTMSLSVVVLTVLTCGFLYYDFHWYALLTIVKTMAGVVFEAAYSRLFPHLVDKAYLERASGWASTVRHIALTVGAMAGSFLVTRLGSLVFLVDAATFLVFFALLQTISIEISGSPEPPRAAGVCGLARKLGADIATGARYLLQRRSLLKLVILSEVAQVCWGVQDVAMWAIVFRRLRLPEQAGGSYMAVATFGELVLAVALARGLVRIGARPVRQAAAGVCLLGLTFVGTGLTQHIGVAFAFKLLEGIASVWVALVMWNLLVLQAPDHLRGRISATMGALNAVPMVMSRLITGSLVDVLPAGSIYVGVGAGVLLIAGAFAVGTAEVPGSPPISGGQPDQP